MNEKPKKILIVEDELPLLELLTDEFSKRGYTVLQARNGATALKTAIDVKPNLILLDIVMPVLDGMTTLRELRKDPVGKEIPVILLTNLSDSVNVSEALKLGSYKFIVKSDWKIEDVIKKVQEALGDISDGG